MPEDRTQEYVDDQVRRLQDLSDALRKQCDELKRDLASRAVSSPGFAQPSPGPTQPEEVAPRRDSNA